MSSKLRENFFSLLKFTAFIAACVIIAFAVIAPLWLFASKAPRVYSAIVITAVLAVAALKIFYFVKKAGARKALVFAGKILLALLLVGLLIFLTLKFR